MEYGEQRNIRNKREQLFEIKKVVRRIRQKFNDEGEEFDDGDEKLLVQKQPKAGFPYVILCLAILKDILNIPMDLTIVGYIIVFIFSVILSVVLAIWCWHRAHGGWWKRMLIRWLWRRFMVALVIEFIPFVDFVPAYTIFILMVHYKQKKLVRLFNAGLEELHRAGVVEYVE